MTIDINKLEAAAKAATQGSFSTRENGSGISVVSNDHPHTNKGPVVIARLTKNRFGDAERNAEFYATANPQAVLELINQLREAELQFSQCSEMLNNAERALEEVEKDAARWNWMLERMSGKDVMIFAQRPAGRDDYCDEIVDQIDKAMEESA